MGVLNKGTDFSNGDQVTDTNLDNLVDNATFTSSAVDDSTTTISGAGAIIIKDGAVGAANVTATGSTSNRSVSDRFADVPNVKDFGAIGDGVADDTLAIKSALDTGGVVYFPAGTYIMSSTSFSASIYMVGDGTESSIIKWKANDVEDNLFDLSGTIDVFAEGLTFDGNQDNQTDSTGYYGTFGGTFGNGSELRFNRCEFINGRIEDIEVNGPTLTDEYVSLHLTQCRFYDGMVARLNRAAQAVSLGDGVRVHCADCEFIQPTVPVSYGRGGIVMQRPATSTATSWGHVDIRGCTFENFGKTDDGVLGSIYIYSGSEATTISSNIIKNAVGSAITAKADCSSTVVQGNVVDGGTTDGIVFFDQVDSFTSSNGQNLIINGNTVRNVTGECIFVDGDRPGALADFENVIISNNIVDGGTKSIFVRNVSNVSISNNLCNGASGVGIQLFETIAGLVRISGNALEGLGIGIDVNGTTTSAVFDIFNNSIRNLSSDAISFRSAVDSFNIQGNTIIACDGAFTIAGATEPSYIMNNIARDESFVLDKTGSYGDLYISNNPTEQDLPFSSTELTVSSGAITVFSNFHYVDTEGDAGTDDLDTINGGFFGQVLTLAAASSTRDIVLKDGTGNLKLSGDCTLDHGDDTITLIYIASSWREISRSNNNT